VRRIEHPVELTCRDCLERRLARQRAPAAQEEVQLGGPRQIAEHLAHFFELGPVMTRIHEEGGIVLLALDVQREEAPGRLRLAQRLLGEAPFLEEPRAIDERSILKESLLAGARLLTSRSASSVLLAFVPDLAMQAALDFTALSCSLDFTTAFGSGPERAASAALSFTRSRSISWVQFLSAPWLSGYIVNQVNQINLRLFGRQTTSRGWGSTRS